VPKSGKSIQQVAALPLVATSSGFEVVLITSRNDGRWLIPKGWPEDGERVHSNVSVFLLVVRELQKNWPERGDRKRRRFSLAKAARRVGGKDLARLLRELDGKRADDLKAALKG